MPPEMPTSSMAADVSTRAEAATPTLSVTEPVGVPATRWTKLWYGSGMAWTGVMTVVFALGYLATRPFAKGASHFQWWAKWWGRAIMAGLGIQCRVQQTVPLAPDTPYVFVSNHQNSIDITAMAGVVPVPFGFVAKAELARVPFLGTVLRHSPSVFVDRRDPRKAIDSLKKAGEQIRAGHSVLVFAEGGRSFGPALQPFKRGAFLLAVEAGVPIVPITILDAYQVLNEKRSAARPGTVRFVIGQPISLAGKRRQDIPDLMAAVRTQMEAAFAEAE